MADKLNILLTSVGRRSYLIKYFQEALGEAGDVHLANSTAITPAFSLTKNHVITPLIYDKSYVPFLIQYCQAHQIHAIISLFDIDLPILSAHKQIFFDAGIHVIVSSEDVIDICNDKWKTYQFCCEKGFAAPLTYVSLDKAKDALTSGKLHFPVIIKPRWGMGSIGIFEAENNLELDVLYEMTKRQIMKTYLKYESEGHNHDMILIQEKLLGEEYGMDVINNLQGEYQNTIIKRKYAMRAGETDCAETIFNDNLEILGKKLSHTLHHISNLDVDLFLVNGEPYVLEMNARFGGGYPFSHMAGVNLPLALVQWLLGESVDSKLLAAKPGVLSHKDINLVVLSGELC